MTTEIEKLIQNERDMIERQLKEALERRDAANEDVKELRRRLDAAPRLHVRRSRKAKGDVELPTEPNMSARGPRLPSALEMFPNGIERNNGGEP